LNWKKLRGREYSLEQRSQSGEKATEKKTRWGGLTVRGGVTEKGTVKKVSF